MNGPDLGQPPRSNESEQVVLGSMLAAPALIADIANVITSDDLYEPKHATLMEAMQWLDSEAHPVGTASVITRLRDIGELTKVGGPEYILHISRAASVHSAMYHAQVILEKSQKRRTIAALQKALRNAQDGTGLDTTDVVGAVMGDLDDIMEERGGSSDIVTAGQALDGTLDQIEALANSKGGVTGVPTGFAELDRMTYGFHEGQMIVIAARPGYGKSTLGLDVARSAAIKHNIPTAIFSLEMSRNEINQRLLSAECKIELGRLRSGNLSESDWSRIGTRMEPIQQAPLFLDDNANNTMSQIRAKCRRLKQRGGLGLVVIDYLQLMTADRPSGSRQQDVSDISRGIKLLAKELGAPVIAMSQLNRGSENRTDPRPKVSDLRESGSIEQDADLVILIDREEVRDPETPRAGEADIIIGKQRGAATGTCVLGFQGGFSRFVDMQRED